MSFTEQVKNEVARSIPERRCCLRAELAALARVAGSLRLGPEGRTLLLTTARAMIARTIFKLTKGMGWQATISIHKFTRPRRYHVFVVELPVRKGGLSLLQELGLADRRHRLRDRIDARLLERLCCRRAFLQGCFLGSGFISNPDHSYQLEFHLNTREAAGDVRRAVLCFGLDAGLREHHGRYVVYLRDADEIGEFLRIIGAAQGVLHYENGRVLKEMRNRVNRLVNCETANLKKTVDTGLKQVEMIRAIQQRRGLASLRPGLREVAELRLRHPEASLAELGRLLKRPLGKSGVNHRMRQLQRLAEEIMAADRD